MSKFNQINLGKNGIESEKLTSENNTINKIAFPKSTISQKEDLNFINNKGNNFQKLSHSQRVFKEFNNKYRKFNSDFMNGFISPKKENIKYSINSEQERFYKFQKKFSERNNNMNKRVKVFVPAKEYLDLLEEIDREENGENKSVVENIDINNNSEEEKLGNFIFNKMMDSTNNILQENLSERKNHIIKTNVDSQFENISTISNKYNKNRKSKDEKDNLFKEQLILKEKRELKFIKEFDEKFGFISIEIFFKYGYFDKDINRYTKSILIIRKNILYVLKRKISKERDKEEKNIYPDFLLNRSLDIFFPLLCLNLNILSCILLINKNKNTKEFQINILGTNKTFSFIIIDEKEYNKYIYLITDIINKSEGFKQNKLGVSLRNNIFYKVLYITPSDFQSIAKTGDIILFKSIDTCAKLQRLYTCDNYDHIGIIFIENNKIKIFESTSIGKCSPLSWTHFKILYFNLVYEKIAYRQLKYENENKQIEEETYKNIEEKCKNFIKEIKGKNYYLSITKFLCCQKPDEYEYDKKFEESKGFCCSALAAALYTKIGVAKLQKSVHSIKPGDFEQKRNKIYFEEGYSLGPEQILDFSE